MFASGGRIGLGLVWRAFGNGQAIGLREDQGRPGQRIEPVDELGVVGHLADDLQMPVVRLEFLELARRRVAGDGAEVVDEEPAGEVVGFMLDGAADQLLGFQVDLLALKVVRLDPDLAAATNRCA